MAEFCEVLGRIVPRREIRQDKKNDVIWFRLPSTLRSQGMVHAIPRNKRYQVQCDEKKIIA